LVVLSQPNRLGRKEPNMIIIGVDFHPEFQQIALVDTDSGEFQEKRLMHREEAERFYRALAAASEKVRVGMEASGFGRWFERLLGGLRIELWMGDATEIQRKRERKQKTDRQDAQHILKLMLKDDFPRILPGYRRVFRLSSLRTRMPTKWPLFVLDRLSAAEHSWPVAAAVVPPQPRHTPGSSSNSGAPALS
jgi:Transposase